MGIKMSSVQQRKKDESGETKPANKVEVSTSSGFGWMSIILLALVGCGGVALFKCDCLKEMITNVHDTFAEHTGLSLSGSDTIQTNGTDLTFPLAAVEALHTEKVIIGDAASRVIANGDNVKLHVKGLLTTGTEFWATGNPPTEGSFDTKIGAGQLIAGFDQGVVGMHIGELRRIYIPWTMGYGASGMPPTIPPKSDLIFEVQLAEFNN